MPQPLSPILLLLLSLLPIHSLATVTNTSALLSFKSLLSDPTGALSSWNSSSPNPCSWHHVKCDTSNHVTYIDVSSLHLAGPISPSLSLLPHLRVLNLSDNYFTGPIPATFSNLTSLRTLNLSYNSLSGPIPTTFSNLSSLENLRLKSNSLSGPIPSSLCLISSLKILRLGFNQLTGDIPNCLSLLPLTGLDISGNNLTGEVPSWFGHSNTLRFIYLSASFRTGTIPSTFCANRSSPLFWLDLSLNNLAGTIPPTLGNCSGLSYLNLFQNSLTGTVPLIIGRLPLKGLELSNNNLHGLVPSSIYNISSMNYLQMANNRLKGVLPDDIGLRMPLMLWLDMSGNLLHGRIPSSLANATWLNWIDLRDNHFSGKIDVQLGGLQSLYNVDLSENSLEAGDWSFLGSLTNCSRLRVLILSHNLIGANIPARLGNLSRTMEWLVLNGNGMTEYGIGDKLSTRGDVYSYGILLLEMLTGRRPTDPMSEEGVVLRQFVEAMYPERVMEIVDQTLLPMAIDGDVDSVLDGSSTRLRVEQCLVSLISVGLLCSKETASERMEMRHVILEMQAIKATYLKEL